MPFTDEAKRRMLAGFEDGTYWVALGHRRGAPHDIAIQVNDSQPAAFMWSGSVSEGGPFILVNATEIVFDRAPEDMVESLTHWLLMDGERVLLAHDRLERPILLRKGERATFAPGALRLELR